METIDIFYQGEGLREIGHLEVGPDHTFAAIKTILIEKHGFPAEVLIFLEDADEPVDENAFVHHHAGPHGLKAHLHRHRHIEVSVAFNRTTVDHRFGPSATIARVKRWAAEDKFGMNAEEAGEHVLQISGSHDRPAPGVHIGALAPYPSCRVAFDLVPDERVNGHSGERA